MILIIHNGVRRPVVVCVALRAAQWKQATAPHIYYGAAQKDDQSGSTIN